MAETQFGRYRLLQLLGRGGMGEVWRARDSLTDNRIVAVKILPPHLAADNVFQQRFRREAQAAAQLNNPHVIPIHGYGEIDGRLYVDMRLVDGRDLQSVLSDGRLEVARAVRIVEQVARALHAAHRVGLIHRDVKPSNILLDDDDFAYLIDFGIARATGDTPLTGTGATIGTWQYMAPERFSSREADARADIYALACVLYECLTGVRPFPGDSLEQQFAGHFATPPPRPSAAQPGVPAGLDDVIAVGMAKDPGGRYSTTVELARAAHEAMTPTHRPVPVVDSPPPTRSAPTRMAAAPALPVQSGPTTPARRRRRSVLIVGGVVSAVAVVVVVALVSGRDRPSPADRTPAQAAPQEPTQTVLPFTGLSDPSGVAVSSAGDVYVTDYTNSRVLELAAGSTAQTTLPFVGLRGPNGLAVDASDNVYVADYGNNRVVMLTAGSSNQTVLPLVDLQSPVSVAVDEVGGVYAISLLDNRVVMLAAGSTAQTTLPFVGLSLPVDLAVDDVGSVYVTDTENDRVVMLPVGSDAQTVLPFAGLDHPTGVAVDAVGNVYVADTGRVVMLAAGSTAQTVLPITGLDDPAGVAVDREGGVYVADWSNRKVVKLIGE